MSSNDSGRPPPQPGRRRVLRKIASRGELSSSGVSDRPPSIPPDRPSLVPRDRPSQIPQAPLPLSAAPSSAPKSPSSAREGTDVSDSFDLLANAERAPSAMDRLLERSSPSMFPPPAAPSSARPPQYGSQPSFDSPAPGAPPAGRHRASLPPVVASVSEQRPLTPPPSLPATSTRRASLVGGGLGLAFVAMFVVGARLAYRPAPEPTPAIPTAVATAVSPAPSAAPPASASATTAPAGELTVVIQSPLPKHVGLGPKPNSAAPSAKVVVAQPGSIAPEGNALPFTAPSNRTPSSTVTGSSEPAENVNPLVPVIPSAAPPDLDPLVKAVLEDDQPSRK
jgi:hypothetical protein